MWIYRRSEHIWKGKWGCAKLSRADIGCLQKLGSLEYTRKETVRE
jgi:hypothetical protein